MGNSKNINFTEFENIRSKSIRTKKLCVKNITSQNITSQNITSQNITSQNITSQNIITKDLDISGKVNLFQGQLFFEVGKDKEFKNLNEILNLILQRVLLSDDIVIKVHPGIYDGFTVPSYSSLNTRINIKGDERFIASSTYINKNGDDYYTFIFSQIGDNTKTEIIENISGNHVNLKELGLIATDKIIFYNNDNSIIPKSLRFIESNVLEVNEDYFILEGNLNYTNQNSTITFLPNVFIKCNGEKDTFPLNSNENNPFTSSYNIFVSGKCSISGMSLLSTENFSTESNIQIYEETDLNDMVVISTKWNDITIDNFNYVGFSSPGSIYSFAKNNLNNLSNFIVLGTGNNDELSKFSGPMSIYNGIQVSLSEIFIIGAVENPLSKGIIYLFNTSSSFFNVNIIGTSNFGIICSSSSIYLGYQIFIQDCKEGIASENNSFIDITKCLIEDYELGIISTDLSKILLKELVFTNGTTDFCINDLSQILRDGAVVIAPNC